MASCTGERKSAATCNSMVHRCDKCRSIGCDQIQPDDCSTQGFWFGTCLNCGAINLLAMTPQLRLLVKALKPLLLE